MKDLTDEFKLSVRSTANVFLTLGRMVDRLKADRRVRFRGKKPTRATVVNAALLYLDTLPPEQWEQAVTIGLRRLEEILADGGADEAALEPELGNLPALKVVDTNRVDLKVEDVSPEPASEKPATRRKKRG